MNFDRLHKKRKEFIKENKNRDHVVIKGKNKVLISAPHGVSQVRLGRLKYCEIGSLATALHLQNSTDCYLIAKTKNNNDDANFDNKSQYKDSILNLLKQNKIKYLLDIHGLSAKRDYDINLGTHLGKNIENNEKIFENLVNKLECGGFKVSIDQPFMAGSQTISSSTKKEFVDIWSLQIEINCEITNKKENIDKYNKLLTIFEDWIKKLN